VCQGKETKNSQTTHHPEQIQVIARFNAGIAQNEGYPKRYNRDEVKPIE
jgi:hypothetical protein